MRDLKENAGTIQSVNTKSRYQDRVASAMQVACKKIAPLWSLDSFVAVNPYMGLSHMAFDTASLLLARAGNINTTMPASFYIQAFEKGKITENDIQKALDLSVMVEKMSVREFIQKTKEPSGNLKNVPLVCDTARTITGKSWNDFLIDRITSWASVHFDKGQVQWSSSDSKKDAFSAWREYALVDATPEIMGLKKFRKVIQQTPAEQKAAAISSMEYLQIPEEGLDLYLHSLLLKVGGWSSYMAGLDWNSNLYHGKGDWLMSFLTILLCWESSLIKSLKNEALSLQWKKAVNRIPEMKLHNELPPSLNYRLIFQRAFDIASHREVISKISRRSIPVNQKKSKPLVQAVFCIDVRSEVFRRNLESVTSDMDTIGFAGFFGFPVSYIPIGHTHRRNQCPALIPSGPVVLESTGNPATLTNTIKMRTIRYQVKKAWKSFKEGAVSCFSFMGPVGLAFLPKLFTDAWGLTRPVKHPDEAGVSKIVKKNRTVSLEVAYHRQHLVGIPFHEQLNMAKSALEAMSLTDNFAKLVLISGHGSSTVNNPHASGLDCGACGGNSGEVNAKIAARVLNKRKIRNELAIQGIIIPADTHFLAGLHNTTTDEVTLFFEEQVPVSHKKEIAQLKQWLAEAGHRTRVERAARFQLEKKKFANREIFFRSKDWSQVRPEWGLAGCQSFVVAPRERTRGVDLKGEVFLHSYTWKKDNRFNILENIMTAPMIVTSWINLQYYASVVDNKQFGSGNKTLHNVTSGIGVLEEYSGDLRTGLPWQSVHDGKKPASARRLNVIIEAPVKAINKILKKHPSVKQLFDNDWITLHVMNDEGMVAYKYHKDFQWEKLEEINERVLESEPSLV